MNGLRKPMIIALFAGGAALAQKNDVQIDMPDLEYKARVDAEEAIAKARDGMAKVQTLFSNSGAAIAANLDMQGFKSDLSLLHGQDGMLFLQSRGIGAGAGIGKGAGRSDGEYDRGTRALDDHNYEDAVTRFDIVIAGKSPRSDGALYWKAYALSRIGRRDDALASLAALRRDYPASHWLNDAQALETEVKQNAGQTVSPAQENNEDLKLMAINSLMSADPDRAMPLLEGILKGNSSPKVKDRALFVLTQNRAARAQQILVDYAKGAGNPDLQMRAIRYLGMSGTSDTQQQLTSIYSGSGDAAVKREIIRVLMSSRGKEPLFNLAKNEKDESLRGEAITQLGNMRAGDQLAQLYGPETSVENRILIIRSLFVAGASDKLLELARTEKDPRVRYEAIRNLAMTRGTSPDTLAGFYSSDSDLKAKKEIVNGLMSRGDAKPLVDLARKENDPAMKKYIVERLSGMHSKEATEYMMELLK